MQHSFDLQNVEITTARLRLVPISHLYTDLIFKHFTSVVTTYMFPKPPDKIEETIEFIDYSLKTMEQEANLQLVILKIEDGAFLGCAGLHNLKENTPELGIWIRTDSHGKGYGFETIEGIVNWAKENTSYEELKYPVDKRNTPSRRIPEKLNGYIVKEYEETNLSGNKLYILEYRIRKEQQ